MRTSRNPGPAIHRPGPVVLIVRDGWGRNPHPEHDEYNAIKLADTPRCDALLLDYPWTLIKTSGEDVGLPAGTMGNSEVGHQNLGAGRIVDQDSVRISNAIKSGTFFDNEVVTRAVDRARDGDGALHLMGLASDAGVHARLEHLYALVELAAKRNLERVWIHLFTDGRDTGPFTGLGYVEQVAARCRELGVGRVASICGRYWAMDRDNRWERVASAYDCLTGRGPGLPHFASAEKAVQDYYDHPSNPSQEGDEFVSPRTVGSDAVSSRIADGDTVVFYNYRGDRPREITRAFVLDEFEDRVPASPDTGQRGFDRGRKLDLHYVTMTSYAEDLAELVEVVFPKPPKLESIAGGHLAALGLTQFRCAETEKSPHVTFFFNDYRDRPFEGESRRTVQSPRVTTYDLKPEMSALGVCECMLERLRAGDCEDFLLVNFANTDMVGHTGKLEPAIRAAEAVDQCVGAIVDATLERGGKLIVTADHGNSEQMWDPENDAPHTAHTTYDVECIVVDEDRRDAATGSPDRPSSVLRAGGRLADVFPTVLELMGLDQPEAMTGRSLLRRSRG
ncbi:MAG: 2,3-bisphosphoglycerate-independent phosphoglycerate mutase [bacterium]|nr:2,3-bisphosphoglycerate-independent phosphoglycerate mutase [bacterium]